MVICSSYSSTLKNILLLKIKLHFCRKIKKINVVVENLRYDVQKNSFYPFAVRPLWQTTVLFLTVRQFDTIPSMNR